MEAFKRVHEIYESRLRFWRELLNRMTPEAIRERERRPKQSIVDALLENQREKFR